MEDGVLAIQGPPGAGKTFTGATIIRDLVKQGKKVGVMATSHKVVLNLLEAVLDLPPIRHTGESRCPLPTYPANNPIAIAHKEDDVLQSPPVRRRGRPDVPRQARSLPLGRRKPGLGPRPRGLPRGKPRRPPRRPPAARTAEEGLDDYLTIPKDRGIFLPITWRLAPSIATFTSELFYESLLTSKPGLENQSLTGTGDLDGSGLHLLEVPHEGNRNSSEEEIEAIAALVSHLTTGCAQWINENHEAKRISGEDILVVAPYNAQVTRLAERLAPTGARVGTVDKFQGQEAAIVIYSMATSRPEDAPRGLEFLYSLNRLNVATSRARCAAILVMSPRLFEPECKTPRQMKLANALCRFREIGYVNPNAPSLRGAHREAMRRSSPAAYRRPTRRRPRLATLDVVCLMEA